MDALGSYSNVLFVWNAMTRFRVCSQETQVAYLNINNKSVNISARFYVELYVFPGIFYNKFITTVIFLSMSALFELTRAVDRET